MLYVVGGFIGGSIQLLFRSFGLDVGVLTIGFIWLALLAGTIYLFHHFTSQFIKLGVAVVIAYLLYIVDVLAAGVSFLDLVGLKNARVANLVFIGMLVALKSLLLALILNFGLQSVEEE